MSKDSLYAQGIDVINLENDKKTSYKVWQTKKTKKIPTELQINGISHGEMKDLEITSYVNSAFPNSKDLSYRTRPDLKLKKHVYELSGEHEYVKANYFTKFSKKKRNASTLIDKKHSDKFVYLLDNEYEFKKNEDEEDILVPIEDGGKTTVKTLGDIRSIWVPVITSIIVLIGLF